MTTQFKKSQGRVEFGAVVRRPAADGAAGAGTSGLQAQQRERQDAIGREVAAFYSELVDTSGAAHWADAEGAPAAAAAAAAAADSIEAAEPSHAGVGVLPPRGPAFLAADQFRYAEPAGPSGRPGPGDTSVQPPPRYGIPRSNIGFQLLQQAGWKEGTGLGARGQGPREPIQPAAQQGQLGLGFAPAARRPSPAAAAGRPPGAAAGGGAAGASSGQAQAAPRSQRPLPEDPLEKEPLEKKVKRVKAVMQAEADDRACKAISRYIYSAFRDATGEPTSDANPLLRRNHKLSATNPLL
eukprot:scaffold15.g4350.t1